MRYMPAKCLALSYCMHSRHGLMLRKIYKQLQVVKTMHVEIIHVCYSVPQ